MSPLKHNYTRLCDILVTVVYSLLYSSAQKEIPYMTFLSKIIKKPLLSVALSVVMAFVSAPAVVPLGIIAGVAVTQTACDKNKIREARKAAFRIQVVTDAAVDTTASLFSRGVITKEQTSKIAQALLKVNHANRVLIDRAAGMTEDSASNRAALFETVRQISAAIVELKGAGVLGIKNPDGSAAFDAAIAALDTSLALIAASLAGGGN